MHNGCFRHFYMRAVSSIAALAFVVGCATPASERTTGNAGAGLGLQRIAEWVDGPVQAEFASDFATLDLFRGKTFSVTPDASADGLTDEIRDRVEDMLVEAGGVRVVRAVADGECAVATDTADMTLRVETEALGADRARARVRLLERGSNEWMANYSETTVLELDPTLRELQASVGNTLPGSHPSTAFGAGDDNRVVLALAAQLDCSLGPVSDPVVVTVASTSTSVLDAQRARELAGALAARPRFALSSDESRQQLRLQWSERFKDGLNTITVTPVVLQDGVQVPAPAVVYQRVPPPPVRGVNWRTLRTLSGSASGHSVGFDMHHTVRIGERQRLSFTAPKQGRMWLIEVDNDDNAALIFPHTACEAVNGANVFQAGEQKTLEFNVQPPVGDSLIAVVFTEPGVSLESVFKQSPGIRALGESLEDAAGQCESADRGNCTVMGCGLRSKRLVPVATPRDWGVVFHELATVN